MEGEELLCVRHRRKKIHFHLELGKMSPGLVEWPVKPHECESFTGTWISLLKTKYNCLNCLHCYYRNPSHIKLNLPVKAVCMEFFIEGEERLSIILRSLWGST